MEYVLKCPICNRRIVGSLCPIHGRVYGGGRAGFNPQQTQTLNGVRSASTAVTATSAAVTALSSDVTKKFPVGEVRLFVVGTAPAGWTKAGTTYVDMGGGIMAYYYKYTG